MVDPFANLINIPQLEMIGFKVEYFTFFLAFLLLVVFWLLVKRMGTFLIKKNYLFVLSYIITSLIIIATASILSIIQWYPFQLVSIFHIVILSGFCLSLYLVYQHIKSKV